MTASASSWPLVLTAHELAFATRILDPGSLLPEQLGLPPDDPDDPRPHAGLQSLVARQLAGFGDEGLILDSRVATVGATIAEPTSSIAILLQDDVAIAGARVVDGGSVRFLLQPRYPALHVVSLLDRAQDLADVVAGLALRYLDQGEARAVGIECERLVPDGPTGQIALREHGSELEYVRSLPGDADDRGTTTAAAVGELLRTILPDSFVSAS